MSYIGDSMTDVQGRTQDGIAYETFGGPSFTVLICHMAQGQSMQAEKGALMYMHRTIEMKTHSRGGVLKSLKASMLGGESFFINTYSATHGHGDIAFVAPMMGDIKPVEVQQGYGWIIQKQSYLCGAASVTIDTKYQGLKGFLAEGSLFMLYAYGQGTLFVNSFGAIMAKQLQAGEVITVDNGHLVAFQEGIPFNIRRVGGLKSTILSGEGLVVDLTGPGLIYLQTRDLGAFANSLMPYIGNRR
jgi:uncharacterized protein (TIGR00266 family)